MSYLKRLSESTNLPAQYNLESVQTVGGEDIPPQFLNPSTQKKLFPDDSVVVFWEPYRPLQSNFRYIMQTSTCQLTSGEGKVNDKFKVKAASFVSDTVGHRAIRLDLDFYVDVDLSNEEKENLLYQHILRTLTSGFHNKYPSDFTVSCSIFTPEFFSISAIKAWFKATLPDVSEGQFNEDTHNITVEYDREKVKQSV